MYNHCGTFYDYQNNWAAWLRGHVYVFLRVCTVRHDVTEERLVGLLGGTGHPPSPSSSSSSSIGTAAFVGFGLLSLSILSRKVFT